MITLVKDEYEAMVRTVESVSNQSIAADHLIVASNEEQACHALIKSAFSHTKIIQEAKPGIYPNMNFAISRIISGPVMFLNSGDTFYDARSLESLLQALKKTGTWAFGGHVIPGRGTYLPRQFTVRGQLYARKYVCHQAVIADSDFLRRLGGFDERLEVAADWDLLCRFKTVAEPAVLNFPVVIFEQGGFAAQNRTTANRELLLLRAKYGLHGSQVERFESRLWYSVRILRNSLVQRLGRTL